MLGAASRRAGAAACTCDLHHHLLAARVLRQKLGDIVRNAADGQPHLRTAIMINMASARAGDAIAFLSLLTFFSSVVCSAMSSHDTLSPLPMCHTYTRIARGAAGKRERAMA